MNKKFEATVIKTLQEEVFLSPHEAQRVAAQVLLWGLPDIKESYFLQVPEEGGPVCVYTGGWIGGGGHSWWEEEKVRDATEEDLVLIPLIRKLSAGKLFDEK